MFTPKYDLNHDEPVKIKLIGFGQEKTGNYGPYYPDCTIEVAGKIQGWNLKIKQKEELDKMGVSAGGEFVVTKVKTKQGYDFIKIDATGDISVQPQNSPQTRDKLVEQKIIPDQQAITQKRILKGMCLNCSCRLLQGRTEDVKEVKEKTIQLYDEMKEWLTN